MSQHQLQFTVTMIQYHQRSLPTLYCISEPGADRRSFFTKICPSSFTLKNAGALSSPTMMYRRVLNGAMVSSSWASTAKICWSFSVFWVRGMVAGRLLNLGSFLLRMTLIVIVALFPFLFGGIPRSLTSTRNYKGNTHYNPTNVHIPRTIAHFLGTTIK
jgi:hypothetical protein